jgi:hypothetical protein
MPFCWLAVGIMDSSFHGAKSSRNEEMGPRCPLLHVPKFFVCLDFFPNKIGLNFAFSTDERKIIS